MTSEARHAVTGPGQATGWVISYSDPVPTDIQLLIGAGERAVTTEISPEPPREGCLPEDDGTRATHKQPREDNRLRSY